VAKLGGNHASAPRGRCLRPRGSDPTEPMRMSFDLVVVPQRSSATGASALSVPLARPCHHMSGRVGAPPHGAISPDRRELTVKPE
jgi:hypothetical protein